MKKLLLLLTTGAFISAVGAEFDFYKSLEDYHSALAAQNELLVKIKGLKKAQLISLQRAQFLLTKLKNLHDANIQLVISEELQRINQALNEGTK